MQGKGKVLALDYGSKRIGVASGDLEHGIAFPRDIIENKGDIFGKILSLCEELDVVLVVVGLPLSMEQQQEENPLMREVSSFVEKLRARGLEVALLDERLSSFEASQKIGRKQGVDAQAAQVILQRYFDSLS